MILRRLHGLGLALLFACGAILPAQAAEKGKDPSKRLQQQLNTAQRENIKLTQEKADIENQLKETKDKLATVEKSAGVASRRGTHLSKELESTKTELNGKLAESERQIQAQKQAQEAEKLRLEQAMKILQTASNRQLSSLAGCRERNDRMYKLGNELLDRFGQRNFWSKALVVEPLTGL